MKTLPILSSLVFLGLLFNLPVQAIDGPGDDYEQEADRVANSVRPAPVMRGGQSSQSAPVMRKPATTNQAAPAMRGRTSSPATMQRGMGINPRALGGEDCNPLCGMQGVGEAASQPVQ